MEQLIEIDEVREKTNKIQLIDRGFGVKGRMKMRVSLVRLLLGFSFSNNCERGVLHIEN